MKIEKWREMTRTDLERKLVELRDTLLKTQVKVQTKQVENTAQLSATRRDIARILTLLKYPEQLATVTEKTAVPAAAAKSADKPAVKAKKTTGKK
ncbi:MAG: 50S ribosomal protein L29 [Candidatus Firestonebacteria bacterium]|nr:50S ribosomal protein L29 [Candidatus Firestonebacteria bacterium]